MADTMRALVAGRGPEWVLTDMPIPAPGPGQVPILTALAAEVLPAVARGEIRPIIDTTVDVVAFQKAADRLRSGEAVGKVVLAFE